MAIPIYVILALSAAFCFSLNGILAKLATKYAIKNRSALLFYFYLTGALFLPLLLWSVRIQNPLDSLLPLFLFSLTFFLGNFFLYTVLYKYDISILQPLFHFQTIFSVSLAFLFLGERFPPTTYFWVLLIIIGGVLVGLNEKLKPEAFLSRNFLLFLISIFFFALSDLFARKTMVTLNFYNLRFWSSLILLAMGLIFIPLAGKEIKISVKRYLPVFISGIFGLHEFRVIYCSLIHWIDEEISLLKRFVLQFFAGNLSKVFCFNSFGRFSN